MKDKNRTNILLLKIEQEESQRVCRGLVDHRTIIYLSEDYFDLILQKLVLQRFLYKLKRIFTRKGLKKRLLYIHYKKARIYTHKYIEKDSICRMYKPIKLSTPEFVYSPYVPLTKFKDNENRFPKLKVNNIL